MPELPEVETVRTGLEMVLKGQVIRKVTLRRKDLRIPFPADLPRRLAGQKILAIRRRAKYLLFDLVGGDVLIAHLGMSGRFTCHPALVAGSGTNKSRMPQQVRHDITAHDHVIFEFEDGKTLIYNDARRFGLITIARSEELPSHPLFAALGPEPLEREFSAGYLRKALEKRGTPVKVALMDQALVVGVGNIYASEALFLAGVNPNIPAKAAAGKAKELVSAIQKVLRDAIASGGSSLRDFIHVSGEAGYFQHRFNVYGRKGEPCFQCGEFIKSTRLSGRSTFFCPDCQPQ